MQLHAQQKCQPKNLAELLTDFADTDIRSDAIVSNLCLDSREVGQGSAFFAIPGSSSDGREFINNAIREGACAVLYESNGWDRTYHDANVPHIGIRNLKHKIGRIADRFFEYPSKHLHVVGITGTNGKTTCALLCASALEQLGTVSGTIGTLGVGYPGKLNRATLTTPDAIALQKGLSEFVQSGAQYSFLEVSSHALDQGRPQGVRFDTAVFTNIAHDHLDYHKNLEHYRQSKSKLFTDYHCESAVLNVDDEYGKILLETSCACSKITYGFSPSDVQILNVNTQPHGLEVDLNVFGEEIKVQNHLIGRLNAINVAAVAAVLYVLDIDTSEIQRSISGLKSVLGRLERISSGHREGPQVFVDFAHTEAALEHALASLREFTKGKLWCVFGCGGSRDKQKRPRMGAVVDRNADQIVITDDNPRKEDPQVIVQQILEGVNNKPVVIHDRATAIEYAIANAAVNDTVLIAGKGHETTQTYSDSVVPFDDRAVVSQVLEAIA